MASSKSDIAERIFDDLDTLGLVDEDNKLEIVKAITRRLNEYLIIDGQIMQ